MSKNRILILISLAFSLLAAACATVPEPAVGYDPANLRFDGDKAFAMEGDFVTRFPSRHSGQPNNRLAAEWLREQFESFGLLCELQEWQVINYSVPVDLRNVACTLPGESPQQILMVAHFDQASTTVLGADNDGSGISILLQLAEIFAAGSTPRYTLTFVATDGEEYGMLGSYHYIHSHPYVENILVGMSIDNLGRPYYDGVSFELIGQYRKYGPIWIGLALRQAADAAGGWTVNLRAPMDQLLDQAGPISFMDQGPMVAAGVPAIGLTGHTPADPEIAKLHYHLWHNPDDTMEYQSPETLHQAGRVAEAFVRQLLSMDSFPRSDDGPYLYLDGSHQILRGLPLYLILTGFVALFFVGSFAALRAPWPKRVQTWRAALPHLLSIWLPLLGSIMLTYVFVAVGLMDKYDTYPATSKDPHIYNPRWPAIILFLLGLAVFLYIGRRLSLRGGASRRRGNPQAAADHRAIKSLAFLVIGLVAVYVLLISPFSLLFLAPTLFWYLIAGRSLRGGQPKGARRSNLAGKALDIVLFLLGGLVFYGLFYFFGFVIYDYHFKFAWFMLMMFSIQMTSFRTAIAITAAVGAGLSLVVEPPHTK